MKVVVARGRRVALRTTLSCPLVEQGIRGAILYIWLLRGDWRLWLDCGRYSGVVDMELTAPAVACCAGIAVVWTAGQFTDYLQAGCSSGSSPCLRRTSSRFGWRSPTRSSVVASPKSQRPLHASG
jgi:hypothetical protein